MTNETGPTGGPMPSTVGRYEITGTLGFGAMGAVYRAFDPLIKRTLAIKTIRLDVPRQSPQYAAFIERFYREARISGTLSHPSIVTLFDIGEEGGIPFLAMELVDGRTIASVIEEGTRFKPEKVIALVSQVAAALDYAHSRGIVHRDIKPSNLIVYDGDKVKVTDFGIAKLADSEITHSGVLLGTPSYMSPEQAMGEKLDGRSDIFSLGVCAFEMLSGQQPFPGANVTSILYKLVHVDPIEPADLETNGLVPQKWREVFHKVLAKKPADRYQTASAFVQDLEYCLGSWFSGLAEETVELGAARGDLAVTVADLKVPAPAGSTPPSASGAAVAAPDVGSAVTVARPRDLGTSTRPPQPELQPEPEPTSEATVALPEASPAGEAATVLLKAEAVGEAAVPATVMMPPPLPPSASQATRALQAAEVTVQQSVPPPTSVMPAAPSARKPGLSPLRVLAGGAALALLLAGLVGLTAWQRMRAVPGPSDASPSPTTQPTLAAAPSAAPEPSPTPGKGSLHVESRPPGARVRLNGEPRGETPLELAELPFGTYEVRLERKGYEEHVQTVALNAELPAAQVSASLVRSAPLAGSADILSTPPAAEVKVDGRAAGRTPLRGLSLKPGSHKLELALEGHEGWSGGLDIVAGQRGRVEVRLRALSRPAATPAPEQLDLARIYGPNEVDVAPRKLSGSSPAYPSDRGAPRLRSGERVSVMVQFVVTESGEVRDLKVLQSAGPVVDEAVLAAVRTWKYQPALKHGSRVKSQTAFKQTFLGG